MSSEGNIKRVAKGLREGASCALRGLIAGNEQQMAAAEDTLRAAEEPLRAALRLLNAKEADRAATTGLERAQMTQTLAATLASVKDDALPEDLLHRLEEVSTALQTLGPRDN